MLSPLEKSCLRWLSGGKTMADIAALEGRTIAEIELCVAHAVTSLSAKSLRDALKKFNRLDCD